MSETRTPADDEFPWRGSRPEFRPSERFWPYVEPSEEPSPEELEALDPDLHDALFGPRERAFSMTLSFPRFEADDYERAVALARKAPEYREVGRRGRIASSRQVLPRQCPCAEGSIRNRGTLR